MPESADAAQAPIELYGDGSFNWEQAVGSWAFWCPELQLEKAGIENGPSAGRFELLAALHGLETILDRDRSSRPIQVFIDCQAVANFLKGILKGEEFHPESHRDLRDLLPRIQPVFAARTVMVSRLRKKTRFHRTCHRMALGTLRERISGVPNPQHRLRAAASRSRLEKLTRRRWLLLSQLTKLDAEIAAVQAEYDAAERTLAEIGNL